MRNVLGRLSLAGFGPRACKHLRVLTADLFITGLIFSCASHSTTTPLRQVQGKQQLNVRVLISEITTQEATHLGV